MSRRIGTDVGFRMFVSKVNSPDTCASADIKYSTNSRILFAGRGDAEFVVKSDQPQLMV